MAANLFANVIQGKAAQEEEGRQKTDGDTEDRSSAEGQVGEKEAGKQKELGTAVPTGGRQRRSSRVLGADAAGCYLSFDQQQKKWVGLWSATVVPDVVAYLKPKIKVPQFKYAKKEKVIFKSETATGALRDERTDFFRGLCLFVKLARECKGEFMLISKADLDERRVRLFGLTNDKEVKALDAEDVYQDASNLKAAAVVTASPTSVYTAKTMDLTTFVAEAAKEGGTAVSFEG